MKRKQAILQAAKELFAEKGHPATSTQEIATRAGVSKGLLFYYFKDKHEILKELADEVTTAYLMGLDEFLAERDTARASLEALIEYHFDFIENHVTEIYFLYNAYANKSEKDMVIKGRLAGFYGGLLTRIRNILEAGMAAGEMRRISAEEHAYVLLGALHGVGRLRLFEYIQAPDVSRLLVNVFATQLCTPESSGPTS